jgi:hypothetical protein
MGYTSKKYSALDFHLIYGQPIIKAKILSKKDVTDFDLRRVNGEEIIRAKKFDCNVLIEDIVKGNNEISVGDTIKIGYNTHYSHTDEWEIGHSYLFSLNFSTISGEPSIVSYVSGSGGYFPIIGETAFDKQNFFKQGNKVEWDKFKTNIKSRINDLIY